ncbi:glutamate--cysteine ligase [Coemansia biformis]|uniref:Glutamate--cysteine ligase n=1 Tax=Coemansia biformis TaxID=1286918 RepID=A0A9W7YEU4_9FUNG|nr:glutamate--cysteine ligase [Coemansia biformis]
MSDDSQPVRMYSWKEILPRMEEIRAVATDQFIAAWRSPRPSHTPVFTWHETMGYIIVRCDEAARRIVLSPRAPDVIKELGCTHDPVAANAHPRHPSKGGGAGADADTNDAAETYWRPAHARFALRCEPPVLRTFSLAGLALEIQECLAARRRLLKAKLRPGEMLLTINQFPLLGADTYIDGQGPANGPLLRSRILSDSCLNPAPPFALEIGGIYDRRGSVPYTGVPVFHDTATPWPFVDCDLPPASLNSNLALVSAGESGRDSACSMGSSTPVPAAAAAGSRTPSLGTPKKESPRPDVPPPPAASRTAIPEAPSNTNCLLLDSPLFGIGSGGVLRITMCAADLGEARLLHDHLAPISAIMAALTAATPIVKGHLIDRDCYWDVQCSAVDDRTAQERGIAPLTTAKGTLRKSRYGSIDTYVGPEDPSADTAFRKQYNDCQFTYDKDSYWKMKEDVGIDQLLALHVARLFVRDIHFASERVLSKGSKKDRDSHRSDSQEHFKRFVGCNRQNVCLYPPNTSAGSGWEVGFMSLEVQLTDAENAAFITFILLLSRVIISYRLNLYLPISLMDQNSSRAQRVNAVRDQLFYFRRDVFGGRDGKSNGSGRISRRGNASTARHAVHHANGSSSNTNQPENAEYVELTIDEILNGSKTCGVTGILNIIYAYLPTMRLEYEVEQALRRQLQLVRRRASGKLCTLATWMRNFVQNHPDYRHDSVVSPSINYDMLCTMNDIEEGRAAAPELLG